MNRQDLPDLSAFVMVARERSFTRAAAQLGVTPSALSHGIRGLEERLGVRLLNRTTRSVTPTEAGERVLRSVAFHLDEIETHVAALSDLRERPAGTVRITADELSLQTVLWPRLRGLLADHPDIKVEIEADYRLTDIVAERFDAGVRLGDLLDKDMIAVPVSPPMRMLAVATPGYFANHDRPRTPQELTTHRCINLRLPTYGGLYAWEFERNGRALRVRVDGQLIFNSIFQVRDAALDGFGIAYLMETMIGDDLDSGALEAVLEDWSPPFSGYHLYYPSRRQPTPAFAAIVEALRYRPGREG
ncbi:LysR family transcriptional regulator [Sphingomonas cannabina]|uniref:LysR family transcriptional regulator n=1 Tax=Sphingomonas cannabina TaxID=2899123 RepID=UPI001F1C9E08|nr:LysR family transcriptional regulator [Sphingomonas cannabina]UIJ45796.1 LysR family transcriptional regulator [Sphingomonas cannabina]